MRRKKCAPFTGNTRMGQLSVSLIIGSGTFQDQWAPAGVEMGRWSWSSDAWDFDHDGFPDLYVASGMMSWNSALQPRAVDLNSFFWRQVVANSVSGSEAFARLRTGLERA